MNDTNLLEPQPEPLTPASLMEMAISRGLTPEGLQIMAATYERLQAKHAEMEYARAMTGFQTDCPTVSKSSAVSFPTKSGGHFDSKYARLSDIIDTVRPALSKWGLSYSFETEINGKSIKVHCVLRHVGGHTTRTLFEAPVEPTPKLSDAHATASATSFAQRYAFCLALGIVTANDDDGKALISEPITPGQVMHLAKLIEDTKADIPQFWAFCNLPDKHLDQLPASAFQKVQAALMQRKQKMSKEGGQ